MENLACDLHNALDLNMRLNSIRNLTTRAKKSNKPKILVSDKKFYRHISSKKYQQQKRTTQKQLDLYRLTKSIVSQAVLSASSLNNLVRLKPTHSQQLKEDTSRTKLYVKTKQSQQHPRKIAYKIQKTFRFRNYRLRCIRLRRESRQHRSHFTTFFNHNHLHDNLIDQSKSKSSLRYFGSL